MATLMRRHPLLSYYVLTFGVSWGGFVLALGPSSLVNTNWQAEGNFPFAVMAMPVVQHSQTRASSSVSRVTCNALSTSAYCNVMAPPPCP